MSKRYSLYELVFWILYLSIAFEFYVHWAWLIFPGVLMTLDSLLSNYNNHNNND